MFHYSFFRKDQVGNETHAKKRKVVVVVLSNFLVFNYALQIWRAALNSYR